MLQFPKNYSKSLEWLLVVCLSRFVAVVVFEFDRGKTESNPNYLAPKKQKTLII